MLTCNLLFLSPISTGTSACVSLVWRQPNLAVLPVRSPVASRKGGSRPDKVRYITYSSARKALLAQSPENKGAGCRTEGVPGSTNKIAFFQKKKKKERGNAKMPATTTSVNKAHRGNASYKYWQTYFHGWPWSMMWNVVQVPVSGFTCGN